MGTKKLYYEDETLLEFSSMVIDCTFDDQKKQYAVELEETAFYPGGGGQPADKGYLIIEGTEEPVQILSISKQEELILHYINIPVTKSSRIKARIDGEYRNHFMQQHTGQHILSAVLYHECQLETVSVHLGADYTAIEVKSPELLSDETIYLIEDAANKMIRQNTPVKPHYPENNDEIGFLRRELKAENNIRIIEIEGYDAVGCGGVHCSSTSGAVLIFFYGQERIRGNVRLLWRIGDYAFNDIREKSAIISKLSAMFSSPQSELLERINKATEQITQLEYENGQLKKKQAYMLIEEIKKTGCPINGKILYTASLEDINMDGLREIANSLTEMENSIAVLFSRPKDSNPVWIIACNKSDSFDFNEVKNGFFKLTGGKGGGRHPQWQGSWNIANIENCTLDKLARFFS